MNSLTIRSLFCLISIAVSPVWAASGIQSMKSEGTTSDFSSHSDTNQRCQMLLEKENLSSFEANTWEKDLVNIINRYRDQHGLSPLVYDKELSAVARSHSDYLARNKMGANHNLIHTRYRRMDGIIPWRAAGENVAYNYGHSNPLASAFRQWRHSPGHNRLMLKNWTKFGGEGHTGMGITKTIDGRYYFTQVFLESSSPGPDPKATNDTKKVAKKLPMKKVRKKRRHVPFYLSLRRFFTGRYFIHRHKKIRTANL